MVNFQIVEFAVIHGQNKITMSWCNVSSFSDAHSFFGMEERENDGNRHENRSDGDRFVQNSIHGNNYDCAFYGSDIMKIK